MGEYMFVGKHPHAGELCVPKKEGTIQKIGNDLMYPFIIINCKHGVEWCYAEKHQVKLVRLEELK